MRAENGLDPELVALRVRAELLQKDLSEAAHLLYCWLVWVATSPESDFKRRILGMLKCKVLRMPPGFRLGQMLLELDAQFGGELESHGVNPGRWIEPRERRNG